MHSLNLTIHNQENIIEEVLDRIKINSTGDYELVVMVDGCTDRTEEYVDNFIKKNKLISVNDKLVQDSMSYAKKVIQKEQRDMSISSTINNSPFKLSMVTITLT